MGAEGSLWSLSGACAALGPLCRLCASHRGSALPHPLRIQSRMVSVSLVLNRWCFTQRSLHASQSPAPLFSTFSFKALPELFPCLTIPTCILSSIFRGKLLLYCTSKYCFPHSLFASNPFAYVCLSVLMEPAPMSLSSLICGTKQCQISLTQPSAAFLLIASPVVFLPVYFLSVSLVIQLHWALWLMIPFLFSFSLVQSRLIYYSAHFEED